MDKAKVVLINPKGGAINRGVPLSLAFLRSNVDSSKYDIEIVDCALNDLDPELSAFTDIIMRIRPEVAGVTSWSFNFPEALLIFKKVKEIDHGIATIYGGAHATTYPSKVMENSEIDFLFRGEAELSFQNFLDERKKSCPDFSKIDGLVYRNDRGEIVNKDIVLIGDMDDIKFPDYKSINIERYSEEGYYYRNIKGISAPIQTTRGCPYMCKFCAAPDINGRKIRKFSFDYMLRLIEFLYKENDVRNFNVIDDNFTFYPEYAKAFCREVIKLGYKDIRFDSTNGIRIQRGDPELWRLMRRAGWEFFSIAPESGSERVLKSMGKDLDPQKVPSIVRDIKRTGIKVHAYIMLGYPGETVEDLKKTELLVRKCKFDGLSAFAFQPLPGTQVYDDLLASNEITEDTIPTRYEDIDIRPYLSPTLKDFDLARFAVRLEIILYLVNPRLILERIFNRPNPGKFLLVILRRLPELFAITHRILLENFAEFVSTLRVKIKKS